MKNLIYDIIVGGVLIGALIGIVPIMEANQNYIVQSAITKTGTERTELVYSNSGFEKTEHNMMDIYAFVLQNIEEDGRLSKEIEVVFGSGIFSSIPSTLNYKSSIQDVKDCLVALQDKIKTEGDKKYIITNSINTISEGIYEEGSSQDNLVISYNITVVN